VDNGLQAQLEEDGDGNIRQSWMKTSGLWTVRQKSTQITHVKMTPPMGQWAISSGPSFV